MRQILAGQTNATKRRVFFHPVVDAVDGITVETGEAGGQPEISTNGAAWTATGIGTLVAIGNGGYYAELTAGAVATAGDIILTRYKSANTAESPGDRVHIIAYDPDDVHLGMPNLDAAVSTRATQADILSDATPFAGANINGLPARPKKNAALANFTFLMVSSADHVTPTAGLTVSGQISKDGGAFAALANAVVEIGGGWYKVDFDAAELNADIVAIEFTAVGADARSLTMQLQA